MIRNAILICSTTVFMVVSASAQVTGSGTTNTVPMFTGTSAIGNSPISIYNGTGPVQVNGYNAYWADTTNYNLSLGNTALPHNVSQSGGGYNGTYNIAIGQGALSPNTTGYFNTGIGMLSLQANTTGYDNTAVGHIAMYDNTTGVHNTAVGNGALHTNSTGSANNAFGEEALYNATGTGNAAFGNATLFGVTTGNDNSVFGAGTASIAPGMAITTGNNNSIFGNEVGGTKLIYGSSNILIGTDSSVDVPTTDTSTTVNTSNFLNIGNTIYATNMYNATNTGGNGYVGIGTATPGAKLEVNGGLRFTSDPSGTVQTTAWTGVLCGGDYAEAVDASGDLKHYGPGDVLVLGSGDDGEVEKSSEPYSTLVTGIFATKPGVIGRRETLSKSAQEIPMAMVGIVPTKVTAENGPIHRGDLLVSSSIPGYAMKGTDRSRMLGAVIGKAMGTLDSGNGVIEVVVTLQ